MCELFEHDFLQNWLKVYDKMDLPKRIKINYGVKCCYVIREKLIDNS